MADDEVKAKAEKPPIKVEKPKRYIVEEHRVFELLGSTVTFRPNQILTNPREIQLANDFDVPLRELAPIQ